MSLYTFISIEEHIQSSNYESVTSFFQANPQFFYAMESADSFEDLHSNFDDEIETPESLTEPSSVSTESSRSQSSLSVSSNIENLHEHESDYNSEEEHSDPKRAKFTHSSDTEDEGTLCPICLDNWTSSGDHRLSSLKCGHLFGHKCIIQWIKSCTGPQKRCPQCNVKASMKDIRLLYAKKLSTVDNSELEEYKNKLKNILAEKEAVESQVNHVLEVNQQMKEEIIHLKKKIHDFESLIKNSRINCPENIPTLKLKNSIELSNQPGCRILDFNSWSNLLIASQASTNQVFPGYGIRKVSVDNFQIMQYIHLHMKPIRDFVFHPEMKDMLLTVSLDKSIKISTICSNSRPQNLITDTPLWSCSWDFNNLNYFYVGTQLGKVVQYDLRNLKIKLQEFSNDDDVSGVLSVKSINRYTTPSFGNGGFIACTLNSCHAYKYIGNSVKEIQIPIDGPFTSMHYDNQSKHLLLSTRPTVKYPHARHNLLSLISEEQEEKEQLFELKQTFLGSTCQTLLSRSTQFSNEEDIFVAADQESTGTISIWSLNNNEKIIDYSSSAPLYDMISFKKNNMRYLATLSEKSLYLYNFEGLC